jgi:phosphoglycerate dehydrogenase-like enzyme
LKVVLYSKELGKMYETMKPWLHRDAAGAPLHEYCLADEGDIAEKIAGADVLVTRPGIVATNEVIRSDKKLRLLQQWGAGLDGINFDLCRELGVAVCNTPSRGTGNAEGVAEIALLHMLLLGRKYAFARENVLKGRVFSPRGVSLWRKKVCVVGLGNLGRTITERLAALGMTVRGVNRSTPSRDRLAEMGVAEFFPITKLREAVAGCRFVVSALALNDDTRGIFNMDFFRSMDRDAFFINVARGALVREDDLISALNDETIAGAGLDVLEAEPTRPDNPLLTHKSVTLTPHVGGNTDESLKGIFEFIQNNVDRLAKGEELLSRADR